MTGDSEGFYGRLVPFDDFAGFSDFAAYAPLPEDWVVVLSDVAGSTRAIEAGRYKDVNMVGAASITAVLNACPGAELPYVFGGDGGTLAVPGLLAAAAGAALLGLQSVSEATFGLALRVGTLPVAELRARGADVRVRKFALGGRNHLAMFAGGGLELADALLKDPEAGAPYRLTAGAETGAPDLTGLSCRWEPLLPRSGRMLTLMVQGIGDNADQTGATLERSVAEISRLLGHGLRDSAPASPQSMRFRWPPRGLGLEARATAGRGGVFGRYCAVLASSLVQAWCERFDRRAGPYDAPIYREELRANTDFRKFDGTLRLVLDVSEEQAEAIERYLAAEHAAGRLVYGTHLADSALMTCLVFSLEESRHVHFIDGADGGFAMVARAFKARLAARP